MKIGIDVDGVLTDLEGFQLLYGKKYFGEEKVKNENAYDITEIFDVNNEEREKFWLKYIWKYSLSIPVKEGAPEIIKRLKEEGNEIYIITGRAHTIEHTPVGKLFRKMLEYWFKKNGLSYDQIVYVDEKNSSEEKYEACQHLGIDLMFEDKSENIDKLKGITKIVCFKTLENQKVLEDENVIKVDNFYEAYNIYKEYKNNFNDKSFKVLNGVERASLNSEEKVQYYKALREYYMNLPYDDKSIKKMEKNYKIAANLGIPIFKKIFKPIIIGKENIPEGNNLIFVSNHLGSLDQFPIMCAIEDNRPIHFLAAQKLFKMKRGLLYRKTGCIFVDRKDKNSKNAATNTLTQILFNDGNVFIFPEGTRNYTDNYLLDFKKGALSIAQTTGATIVPFAVNNNYSLTDNKPLIVRVGKPFNVSMNDDIDLKTIELRDTIASMIWENMELEYEIVNGHPYENSESEKITFQKRK